MNTFYDDGIDAEDPAKIPRIVLHGSSRSGKTSIAHHILFKMSPHETLFLEQSHRVEVYQCRTNPFLQFDLIDLYGRFFDDRDYSRVDMSYLDSDILELRDINAAIFVIDAYEDEFNESIQLMHNFYGNVLLNANKNNPPKLYCFVHKLDGDMFVDEEQKLEVQSLVQAGVKMAFSMWKETNLVFYPTSMYNHSLNESFSKVCQSIIQPDIYGCVESLLTSLTMSCGMEKTFIFDVATKLFLSTDVTPAESSTLELCSTLIDLVLDVSEIYGDTGEVSREGNSIVESSHWFTNKSSSVIQLKSGALNGMMLYFRQVNRGIAIVSLIRAGNFKRKGLIDFNIDRFKSSFQDVLDVNTSILDVPEN